MIHDVRLALRNLFRSPGFALVAVSTLALCIGANSAIFSVVNAVLLRPLPFPEAERLVAINNSYPKIDLKYAGVSIPDYLDRIERAPSLEAGALYTWDSYNLAPEGLPVRILGVRATPSLFSTLQVNPGLGRVFTPEEAMPGNDHVVVLSHRLWQEQYGGREDILGQSVRLNGETYEVIGVMPASFTFPSPTVKAWFPFAFTPEQRSLDERGNEYSGMIGRLKPGRTPEMLSAEFAAIIEQNLEAYPQFRPWQESSGFAGTAQSWQEQAIEDVRPMLWLIQIGVLAALLIGCTNVANLLLTRALARGHEFAIRAALGASRWILIRQMLWESLILFLIGGGLGVVVALWGISGLEALNVTDLPRGETVSLDKTVFFFTFACAAATGLGFGLIPALHASRPAAGDALQAGGSRTTGGRRQRALRHGLVVAEVALSLALLTTAILLTRSFHRLQTQPTGFNADSVLTARFTLPDHAYAEDHQRIGFVERIERELAQIPGVENVGLASLVPFGYGNSQGTYRIAGQTLPEGTSAPHGQLRTVTPGFFETLKIPLLRGRTFTAADSATAEQVVVVDQVLVDRHFPDEDPIGQQIYRNSNAPTPENVRTIVGVVAPVKYSGLDDPMRKETLYYPFPQRPLTGLTLMVRSTLPPASLIPAIRRTMLEIDAELPLYQIRTLTEQIDSSLQSQRTPMVLIGLFGGMALLLAGLGVYGALAFSIAQRAQELGIRMALGAASADVLRLVLRQVGWLVGIGALLGLMAYLAVSRLLSHVVYGVSPYDFWSFLIALVTLVTIAGFACYLPARRATRIDPMVALHED